MVLSRITAHALAIVFIAVVAQRSDAWSVYRISSEIKLLNPLSQAWIGAHRVRRPTPRSCCSRRFVSNVQHPSKLSARRGFDSKEENEFEDDEDDDDDEPPEIGDVSTFRRSETTFGFNKGRSSPATRKAMGKSGSSTASIHICGNCGSEFVKWMGRCPTCKEWNTLQEHSVTRQPAVAAMKARPVFGRTTQIERPGSWLDNIYSEGGVGPVGHVPVRITSLTEQEKNPAASRRIVIPDDNELNTVLGGGIMKGSLTLLGGDPGVGKSTLLLQMAGSVARMSMPTMGIGMGLPSMPQDAGVTMGGPVWYVSGEENPDQIASRAIRLGIDEPELYLLRETHVDTLCEQIVAHHMKGAHKRIKSDDDIFSNDEDDVASSNTGQEPLPLSLVVIDSIQTMVCDAGGASFAGGITQVRESVAMFLRLAKSTGIPIMLIGHVTKSGEVAGPRTVEHMVDCILYLEGASESGSGLTNLRMLRPSKNRFGSSDEVGVYEMTHGRLLPVSDPSSLFLAHRNDKEDSEGCAIAISLEGMRAITVEVQALVTMAAGDGNSNYGGRRTVNGVSYSRLMLLMGVLQKHCSMFWSRQDVYINVVGRIRLDRGEGNAADLAIAVALASSRHAIPVRSDTAFVGEVGLLGELRTVPALEKRLQEARRMGFSRVVTPRDFRVKGKRTNKQFDAKTTISHVNGIEWIQCETLQGAINQGLVKPIPKRVARPRSKATDAKRIPGNIQDLGLDEIVDDFDDDDAFL